MGRLNLPPTHTCVPRVLGTLGSSVPSEGDLDGPTRMTLLSYAARMHHMRHVGSWCLQMSHQTRGQLVSADTHVSDHIVIVQMYVVVVVVVVLYSSRSSSISRRPLGPFPATRWLTTVCTHLNCARHR